MLIFKGVFSGYYYVVLRLMVLFCESHKNYVIDQVMVILDCIHTR